MHVAVTAVARPVHRPDAGAGRQADPAAFQLSEDFRGLQSRLQVLHHSRHAGQARLPPPWRGDARGPNGSWAPGVKELLVISQEHLRLRDRTGRAARRKAPIRAARARSRSTRSLGAAAPTSYPLPPCARPRPAHGRGAGVLPYLDIPFQHAHPDVLRDKNTLAKKPTKTNPPHDFP